MGLFRAYIDKKIVDGEGGEHSRVIDDHADQMADFEESLELEDDEVVGQIVELWDGTPQVLSTNEAFVNSVAENLASSLDLPFHEAYALATEAVKKAGAV